MKKLLFLFCFFILSFFSLVQAQNTRPKIGLALSGGGAKGLAHIGLLMAIDSVGINIDYIAGTSMGSIVGGLYASGYTGKEIAEIARKVNWDRVLSNKPDFEDLFLPFKEESKQWLEIPLNKNKLMVGKGILESKELWLWLYEQFSPYNMETDFADLPIPFRCVATRLDNGEAVVLTEGNLVNAIRASMAIPTVFTPVEIDRVTLIDGGLIRNFPVNEVKEMGADLVIGSSVNEQPLTAEDLDNPIKILSQIAFFADYKDYKRQREITDIFVKYPIESYNSGSFGSANEILEIGIEKGHEIIPLLKSFKESLDLVYGYEEHRKLTPVKKEKIKVNKISTVGLDAFSWHLYNEHLNLRGNREYSIPQLSEKIRNINILGNFKKINYSFSKNLDETLDLHLSFVKDNKKFLRSGITYNDDMGLGIKIGLAWKETINTLSSTSMAVSIGENPKFSLHTFSFLSHARNMFFESLINGEIYRKAYYNNHLATAGTFGQNQLSTELHLAKLLNKDFQIGVGARWEAINYNPEVKDSIRPGGNMNFMTTFFRLKFNNQDASFNPRRGTKIYLETGWIFNQHAKFRYSKPGAYNLMLFYLKNDNFLNLRYYSSHAHTIHKQTYFAILNAGIHFGNKLPYILDYAVGGANFTTQNQILFSGFRMNGISTSSAASGQLGIRQNFTSKASLALGVNLLSVDFIQNNFKNPDGNQKFVLGANLTAGYDFLLGPLEITLMYNSINKKLLPTFNIGYSMNFSK